MRFYKIWKLKQILSDKITTTKILLIKTKFITLKIQVSAENEGFRTTVFWPLERRFWARNSSFDCDNSPEGKGLSWSL